MAFRHCQPFAVLPCRLEQRERPVTQPGALPLTRQQDLLELDLPAPDLSLYESEEGGAA